MYQQVFLPNKNDCLFTAIVLRSTPLSGPLWKTPSFSIIHIGLFTTVAFKEMVLNHKTSLALFTLKETPKSVPIMVGMKLTVTSRVVWDPVARDYLWSEFCPLSPKIFSDSLTPSLVLSNGTHIGFAFCLALILTLPTFWSWQKGFLFIEASLQHWAFIPNPAIIQSPYHHHMWSKEISCFLVTCICVLWLICPVRVLLLWVEKSKYF